LVVDGLYLRIQPGENLSDSGISVMACPPGKRNSTIHLASGARKHNRHISIFPNIPFKTFCAILFADEVDAPLMMRMLYASV